MGNPFFITEKETERLLEEKPRNVPMPDGSLRQITDSRLFWEAYDFLVGTKKWTPQELVDLSLRNCAKTGMSFDDSFNNVVCYAHQSVLNRRRSDDN